MVEHDESGTNESNMAPSSRQRATTRLEIRRARKSDQFLRSAPCAQRVRRLSRRTDLLTQALQPQESRASLVLAYERYSLAQINNYLTTVPTLAMRNGDFSGLINTSGVLQQLYDHTTTYDSGTSPCNGGAANHFCRTPFASNQIPIARRTHDQMLQQRLRPPPPPTTGPATLTGPHPPFR